jgi:electron transfer flavoprotein alpha subunit
MLSARVARAAASWFASARSASTLVVAPHAAGKLDGSVASLATAAKAIGGDVHVLVAGKNVAGVAAEAAAYPGVTKVLVAESGAYDNGLAENITRLVVERQSAGGYSHIITSANNFGKNFLPRVAAKLDVAMLTDVSAILGGNKYERLTYAGNAITTVVSTDKVQVLSIRATSFEKAEPGKAAAAPVEAVAVPADADLGLTSFVSANISASDRPELTSADIVVSGGRGLKDADGFKTVLDPLCVKLNAAMGASRAAVDAGFVPNDLQVGQTGKVVAPKLYIAVGISGAIQHLAGMKDSKTIVAINKDPDAPIFQVRALLPGMQMCVWPSRFLRRRTLAYVALTLRLPCIPGDWRFSPPFLVFERLCFFAMFLVVGGVWLRGVNVRSLARLTSLAQVADYGLVGDLFTAVPELTSKV